MKAARSLGMLETMASSPSSSRMRMMLGLAAWGAGVAVGVGVEGEVSPEPPQPAPMTPTPMMSAGSRVLCGFTGEIVTHRRSRRRSWAAVTLWFLYGSRA